MEEYCTSIREIEIQIHDLPYPEKSFYFAQTVPDELALKDTPQLAGLVERCLVPLFHSACLQPMAFLCPVNNQCTQTHPI